MREQQPRSPGERLLALFLAEQPAGGLEDLEAWADRRPEVELDGELRVELRRLYPFEALLARARLGEQEAWSALLARYRPQLLAIIRRRLGPRLRQRLDSEDVQQSVLGDAFRDLRKLEARDEDALLAWLARLVENKLRNKAREAGRQKRAGGTPVSLTPGDSQPSSPAGIDPPDSGPTPSEQASLEEERLRLRAALAALPDDWRRVIELRELQGLDWPAVAVELGVTVKAAQGRFHRARARLAVLYRP